MTARSIDARRFWDRIPIRRARRSWIRIRDVAELVRRGAREVLLSLTILIGWTLFTLGIGAFAGAHAHAVYFLSAGLFFLSLAGWKLLRQLASDGFYALTQHKPRA